MRRDDNEKKTDDMMAETSAEDTTNKAIPTSSLILWAICPDDNSGEWLKLFEASNFSEAYKYRNTFRRIMNPQD